MAINKRLTIDPKVRFGKPIIAGTRIAVVDILNLLAAGYTVKEIPRQYPGVTEKDVLAAIEFTTDILENPAKILQRVVYA